MSYDLVVVGHIVLDYISRKGATVGPALGGPSVYASLAARTLDSSVGVISTVGPDFGHKRVSWLHTHGISVRNIRVANRHTTSFRLNYRNSVRSMKVTSVCNPINAEDVFADPFIVSHPHRTSPARDRATTRGAPSQTGCCSGLRSTRLSSQIGARWISSDEELARYRSSEENEPSKSV